MSLTLSQIWKACQEVAAEEKVSPLGKVSVGALPEGATVKELNVCPAVDCAKAKALGLPADVDSAPPLSSSNPCRPQGPSHTRRAQAEEESAPHAHPRQPQLLRTSVPPAARRPAHRGPPAERLLLRALRRPGRRGSLCLRRSRAPLGRSGRPPAAQRQVHSRRSPHRCRRRGIRQPACA